MAATGYTPIYLYYSSTTSNTPSAGNLGYGELAINITDKNLFFKDNTNAVNTVPIRQSSASSNGWLSSTDWSTFNSKQPAGSYAVTNAGQTFSGTQTFSSNLLGTKIQVGTPATINDTTGVAQTLQLTNYSAGVYVTGSPDNYIYKTSSVMGSVGAHSTIFQTRSDVAAGGFAWVGGSSPTPWMILDANQNLNLSTGNLVIGTSGKGVTTGSAINLGFGTNTSTTQMTLFSSGGVSIGNTTDPGATNLSVTGTITGSSSATITGSLTNSVYTHETNSSQTAQKYVAEKVYSIYKDSGTTSYTICNITSAASDGGFYVEVVLSGQFADFDTLAPSVRTSSVSAYNAAENNLLAYNSSIIGSISFSSVSAGVVAVNVTSARSSRFNGTAYVRVIGGNLSQNSQGTPLGVSVS